MVFNTVVETSPAVGLWTSLGFHVLGTDKPAVRYEATVLVAAVNEWL